MHRQKGRAPIKMKSTMVGTEGLPGIWVFTAPGASLTNRSSIPVWMPEKAENKRVAMIKRRRREEIEDKIKDSKPLADVVSEILQKAPTLSHLFIKGLTLKNPFNLKKVGQSNKPYEGKMYPTYFELVSPKENETKICHLKSMLFFVSIPGTKIICLFFAIFILYFCLKSTFPNL